MFLTFAWSSYIAWYYGWRAAAVAHLAIVVLFNPIVPLRLGREVWLVIDVVGGATAILMAWLHRKRSATPTERESRREMFCGIGGFVGLVSGTGVGVQVAKYLNAPEVLDPIVAIVFGCAFIGLGIFIGYMLADWLERGDA